ncbi:MAG: metallophosphoesterase [Patescibacteria group bacterium]
MLWNKAKFDFAVTTLKSHTSIESVCAILSKRWRETISPNALRRAFRREKLKQPQSYLKNEKSLGPECQGKVAKKNFVVWDAGVIKTTIEVLKRHGTLAPACAELAELFKLPVNKYSMARGFQRLGLKPPASFLDPHKNIEARHEQARRAGNAFARNVEAKKLGTRAGIGKIEMPEWTLGEDEEGRAVKPPKIGLNLDEGQRRLFLSTVQRGPRTINELADQFDVSPKTIRSIFESLQGQGYTLALEHDQVISFNSNAENSIENAKEIPDYAGEDGVFCFGAVADTHFGSKYCDEQAFKDYVDYAYSLGVRTILHAGDLMTGLLNHHGMSYEVKLLGFDEQVEHTLNSLPQRESLSYWYIIGNHEQNSWAKSIGYSPGRALERRARELGRTDIHYIGDIQGRVVFGQEEQAIKVELAHPKVSGSTYAISYPVQKWVERMPGGAKPHILLSGHLHNYSIINTRNVVCIQPGCFEHSTPYTKEMGLHPAVGGVIVWAKRDGVNLWLRSEWVATRTKPVDWTQIE